MLKEALEWKMLYHELGVAAEGQINRLKHQNEKMREVLEQYAELGIRFEHCDMDIGEDARDVLKELYGEAKK